MDFSELCALVGALRDRVADLEAKEAERSKPIDFAISLDGGDGDPDIQALAASAVAAGLASVPETRAVWTPLPKPTPEQMAIIRDCMREMATRGRAGGQVAPGLLYTVGERGPETMVPVTYDPFVLPGAKAEWPKY